MMWDDLDARARGLRGRLLGAARLRALAGEPDIAALSRALAAISNGELATTASAARLDLALRRMAAAQMKVLIRWMGARSEKLRVLLEDEDRRSVRALVRGAAAGVAAEVRLAGLMPTPGLPERALELLATAATPAQVGAALVAMGNPYGPVVLAEAGTTNAGLHAVEIAMDRLWAKRSRRSVRHAGREMRSFVEDAIDVENSRACLALAVNHEVGRPEESFVAGGRRITLDVFTGVATAPDARIATVQLIREWMPARSQAGAPLRSIERLLLGVRIRSVSRQAMIRPSGPSAVLEWALRLRAQSMDLGVIVWSLALGASREVILQQLAGA
jgi:vacuolar-type H+-ATPase subunit C/Vma6